MEIRMGNNSKRGETDLIAGGASSQFSGKLIPGHGQDGQSTASSPG